MANIDWFLFGAFPYVAIMIAIVGAFWRYSRDRFSYTSNSSQFLESRILSRGSVLFHYGIISILVAHLLAFTFSTEWRGLLRGFSSSKNQADWEIWLYSFELAGWVLSIITLVGLALLIGRRLSLRRLQATTSAMDWIILFLLVIQVGLGFWIAFYYSWGSQWYGDTIVPWLESLVRLDPQPSYVSSIGFTVKLHIINAFLLVAIFPFTRLVHIFTIPLTYLWRPYQIWVYNRKTPADATGQELLSTRDHYERRKGPLSKSMPLLLFGVLILWLSYATVFFLAEMEDLLFVPVVIFPIILGSTTLFVANSSRSPDSVKDLLRPRKDYWKISLTDNRLGKWLIRRRWIQFVLEFPNVLFFVLVIVAGIYGYGGYVQADDAAVTNAATFLTWNIWWVGMIFSFLFIGRIWCTVCPLGCIGEWAHRTRAPKRSQLSKRSLIFRFILAVILGVTSALIIGITIGLFAGFNAEVLMGDDKLSSELTKAIPEYFVFFGKVPFQLIDTLIKTDNGSGIHRFGLPALIFSLIWFGIIVFGFLVGAVLGYSLLEFTRAAVVGTPLEQEQDPKRKYPKRLRTLWITVGLFTGIMIFDFAIGMFVNPFYTALFIIILITTSIVLGLFYERRAFCQYVCPLAGIIGTYSMTGMTEIRNKDYEVCRKCKTKDCLRGRLEAKGRDAFGNLREYEYPAGYACPMGAFPMTMDQNFDCIMCLECVKSCRNDNISLNLRAPFIDTYNPRRRQFAQAGLAAVLVGLTLALVLPSTELVADYYNQALKAVRDVGGTQMDFVVIVGWFLLSAFLIPLGSFFIALKGSKHLGKVEEKSTKDLFNIFAYSIIPLGLAIHLAFWVIRIIDQSPSLLSVLADPFGGYFMEHTLFDSTGDLILTDPITFPIALFYIINPLFLLDFHNESMGELIPSGLAFIIRMMVIFLGLAASVYSAVKAIELNLSDHASKTLRIMLPVLAWMILFTALALWGASTWL